MKPCIVMGGLMMTTSTAQMLSVMGPSKSSTDTGDQPINMASPTTTDLSEKQLKLTPSPSPSMDDVLNLCLRPDNGPENTPLK